jgi:hypothetical protein
MLLKQNVQKNRKNFLLSKRYVNNNSLWSTYVNTAHPCPCFFKYLKLEYILQRVPIDNPHFLLFFLSDFYSKPKIFGDSQVQFIPLYP